MFTEKINILTDLSQALVLQKKGDITEIESTDNDPYINIIKSNKSKFKSGWYKFSFVFNLIEGEIILPKIYFNFGNGYSEHHHWKLFYEADEIFGMVKIPWDCNSLRFDVSEKNIKFRTGTIEIIRTSKVDAFYETLILANKLGLTKRQLLKKIVSPANLFGIKKLLKDISNGTYISPTYHSLESLSNNNSSNHSISFTDLKIHSLITSKKIDEYLDIIESTKIVSFQNAIDITVDIILPVYNGLNYLEILLPQIFQYSDLKFKLYITNDASPDPNISTFLTKIKNKYPEKVEIDTNKTNLGFTKTVNLLFQKCANDYIVLLNSDTEVNENWLSRLIFPFLRDEKIATITPMSNCATICSFPNIGDNDLLENFSPSELNKRLLKLPSYVEEIPTGVGFCMAIRKKALDETGFFDEKNFPRGYGEEVDLCFRIQKMGYKNILNGSLFIYHKHGGSFSSVEKKKLQFTNQKKIEELYPEFTNRLTSYFESNTFCVHKFICFLSILKSEGNSVCLFFDHDLGGGTNVYTRNYQSNNSEITYINITFPNPNINPNALILARIKYSNLHFQFTLESTSALFRIFDLANFSPNELILNNLVSYSNLFQLLNDVENYKLNNPSLNIKLLGHDFYPICPNFLLFNNSEFCNIPENANICRSCIANLSETIEPVLISSDFKTHQEWRAKWGSLLHLCNEVTVFSESTKKLYVRTWPKISDKIEIKPHKLIGFTKKVKNKKNICILGNIHSVAKGAKIVKDLAIELEYNNPGNYNLISIGAIAPLYDSQNICKTGAYAIDNLYEKLIEHRIDLIFIPSVCSETFSFTTREAIESNIPTACFQLGGQYDQIKNYSKGIVIKHISTKAILESFDNFFKSYENTL